MVCGKKNSEKMRIRINNIKDNAMIRRTVSCLCNVSVGSHAAFLPGNTDGQFRKILDEIERNSTTLAVYGKSTEAQKIGNRTGLAPENPEIELGYLPGIHGGAHAKISE